MLAYFACSGLDVIDKLDKLPHSKQAIIEWIYSHQITKFLDGNNKINIHYNRLLSINSKLDENASILGFRGTSSLVTDKNVS